MLKGRRDLAWQSLGGRALQAEKQLKQWPESWNKHFLDTELSGTPVGERGQYLSIGTDGAGRLDLTLRSAEGTGCSRTRSNK